MTVRAHLLQAERQVGYVKELHPDPPPYCVAHLWRWFMELHNSRSGNGFGPSPISYQDIIAWATLTGSNPNYWEVSILKRLDAKYLEVTAMDKSKKG